MSGDLKNKKLIVLKGVLFLFIALAAGGLLLLRHPGWLNLFLVVALAWAACRAYYFAFYVITAYVDPSYKYAGIFSAVRHLCSKKSK